MAGDENQGGKGRLTRRDVLAVPLLTAVAGLWPGSRGWAAEVERRDSVSQHGITFVFSQPRPVGRYATGDWFVVGPVEIVAITPSSGRTADPAWVHGKDRTSRVVHGAQLGYWRKSNHQGFDDIIPDTRRHYRFLAEANVDPGFSGRPLRVAEPATVIKTVSLPAKQVGAQYRPCLADMVFLTVVDAPPPAGAFRPSAEPGDKVSRWTEDQLDWSAFPRLPKPQGVTYDWDVPRLLARNTRPHWNERGRYDSTRQMMAKNNQWNYGREHAYETAYAALALCSDLPQAQRRALLVGLVQQGLDLHEMIESGRRIKASDGNAIGRALPLVVAAAALGDERLKASADAKNFAASEHGQFFHVGDDVIGRDRMVRDRARGPYVESMRGVPEFGGQHIGTDGRLLQPERSGSHYWMSYRNLVSNPLIAAGAAAHVIRGGVEIWNQPAFFDYLDRWHAIERYRLKGNPDGLHYGNGPGPLPYAYWNAWRSKSPRPVHKARPEVMGRHFSDRELGIDLMQGAPFLAPDVGGFVFQRLMNPFRNSLLDRDSVYDLRISSDGTNWTEFSDVGEGAQKLGGLQRGIRYFVQMRQRHPEHGSGPWSMDWFWWREGSGFEGRIAPDGRTWSEPEALGAAPAMFAWLARTHRHRAPLLQIRRVKGRGAPSAWKTPKWLHSELDFFVPDEIRRNAPYARSVVTL